MPRDRLPLAAGSVRVHTVDELHALSFHPAWQQRPGERYALPAHWRPRSRYKHNDILYEWGAMIGNLLLRKGPQYGVGGMYFEFENTASPGDPVVAPAVSRDADQGVEYYDGLALSSDRDYLRVPLIAGRLEISDAVRFPKGNETVFFAQTSGTEGVHGKPFSSAVNSTVFGGALVAFVDPEDPTQDLILSRFYQDVSEQAVKLSTTQIGYEWSLALQ